MGRFWRLWEDITRSVGRASAVFLLLKETPWLDSVLSVWLSAISILAFVVWLFEICCECVPVLFVPFGLVRAVGRLEDGLKDVFRFKDRLCPDVKLPCPSERSFLAGFGGGDSVFEFELLRSLLRVQTSRNSKDIAQWEQWTTVKEPEMLAGMVYYLSGTGV
jgi:hypothetical protein